METELTLSSEEFNALFVHIFNITNIKETIINKP